MITIRAPWPTPPLRSNARMHWAVKAQWVRMIRSDMRNLCQWMRVSPIDEPVRVTLVWTVTDRRRRDAGASSPTLKAALDGIVDAGVLPGDHHEIVTAETCEIEIGDKRGVRIEIEPVQVTQNRAVRASSVAVEPSAGLFRPDASSRRSYEYYECSQHGRYPTLAAFDNHLRTDHRKAGR